MSPAHHLSKPGGGGGGGGWGGSHTRTGPGRPPGVLMTTPRPSLLAGDELHLFTVHVPRHKLPLVRVRTIMKAPVVEPIERRVYFVRVQFYVRLQNGDDLVHHRVALILRVVDVRHLRERKPATMRRPEDRACGTGRGGASHVPQVTVTSTVRCVPRPLACRVAGPPLHVHVDALWGCPAEPSPGRSGVGRGGVPKDRSAWG